MDLLTQWVAAHAATFATIMVIWHAFGLVVSPLNALLVRPRWSRVANLLAAACAITPADVAGFLSNLAQAISPTPPSGPMPPPDAGKPYAPKIVPMEPPASKRAWMAPVGAVAALFAALLVAGCNLLNSTTLPADLEHEYECIQQDVESGQSNVLQIVADCRAQEEQTVIDAIDGLLSSKDWTAKHANLVPTLQAKLAAEKARLAGKDGGQ